MASLAALLAGLGFLASMEAVDPVPAVALGASMAGHPEYAAEILALCKVESWGCRRIGIHRRGKRVAGEAFYARAVGRLVHPGDCEHHGAEPSERWGVRGMLGHVAAYAVHYLGPCVAPESLDVPLLSAIVAARRLDVFRRQYGKKTTKERAHAWRHGPACSKVHGEERGDAEAEAR